MNDSLCRQRRAAGQITAIKFPINEFSRCTVSVSGIEYLNRETIEVINTGTRFYRYRGKIVNCAQLPILRSSGTSE